MVQTERAAGVQRNLIKEMDLGLRNDNRHWPSQKLDCWGKGPKIFTENNVISERKDKPERKIERYRDILIKRQEIRNRPKKRKHRSCYPLLV